MKNNGQDRASQKVCARTWYFADYELDELRRELRIKGTRIDLESKPFDLLLQLVRHAGEVVTKEELLESVWSGDNVVDGSLPTAISKLRKVFSDEDSAMIVTIPRVGYRLSVPVFCKAADSPPIQEARFEPGDPVPQRDQWRLKRRLSSSPAGGVWLAEHPKTHELRVFKFAWDSARLKSLKREATLARYLIESTGSRPEFVRILEWNFETLPFFLESEYGGANMIEWAESVGGLANVPLATRLKVLTEVASAVAASHDLGVLHRDLKPANILVGVTLQEVPQIKVADFGIGLLEEPSRLEALRITNLGFTQTGIEDGSSRSGTALYMAPEVLLGHSATVSADVYALGVMLYQLVVGDLRRPLSPGWEADIEDPLIREDIAAAACGDASKRLNSAADLAERLQNLEQRRLQRREIEQAESRAFQAEKKIAEARARRPWVILAAAALSIGCIVSFVLYRRAVHERDRASHQTELLARMNRFLTEDLLAQSNPFKTNEAKKPFVDVVIEAAPQIDRQFSQEPLVAARLHQAIAASLDGRFDYGQAREQYQRATQLFVQAEGTQSRDAIQTELQQADMEARSNRPGSVARAKSLLDEAERQARRITRPDDEMQVGLLATRALVEIVQNSSQAAIEHYSAALRLAQATSSVDTRTRLRIKQRLAFAYIHSGAAAQAEVLLRELVDDFSKMDGPESANVLQIRMNLAESFLSQHKFEEAVQETTLVYPALAKQIGEDHELSLQVLATRAAAEGSLQRWDAAIRDDLAVYNASMRRGGATALFSTAALSDAGLSQCKSGQYKEGEANTRLAFNQAAKMFGARAGLTGGSAYALATCLNGLGRFNEAAELLQNVDAKAVVEASGDPAAGADIALLQGQLAFERRDYPSAEHYVEVASPVLDRSDAIPSDRQELQKLKSELTARLRASR